MQLRFKYHFEFILQTSTIYAPLRFFGTKHLSLQTKLVFEKIPFSL